jgi:8-oxo-dGTP diphosphatase
MIDVIAAIMTRGDQVFIARRGPGKHLASLWEFPGGKLEAGEDPRECLAREMAEEFGIEVAVGGFVGESIFDYGEKVVRLLAYEVKHLSGHIDPKDHDKIYWANKDELEEFEWAPADIPFVKGLMG